MTGKIIELGPLRLRALARRVVEAQEKIDGTARAFLTGDARHAGKIADMLTELETAIRDLERAARTSAPTELVTIAIMVATTQRAWSRAACGSDRERVAAQAFLATIDRLREHLAKVG